MHKWTIGRWLILGPISFGIGGAWVFIRGIYPTKTTDVVVPVVAKERNVVFKEEEAEIDPKLDYVVLYQGNTGHNNPIPTGLMGAKCKLTKDTTFQLCSFTKVPGNNPKKWTGFDTLKGLGFSAYVKTDFFNEPKTLYKARVSTHIVNTWRDDPSQNLEIYEIPNKIDNVPAKNVVVPDKLLKILKPTFAFRDGSSPKMGKTNFFVGVLKGFTPILSNYLDISLVQEQSVFDPNNKWFKCSLPGQKPTTETCYIYEFDPSDHEKVSFLNNTLQLPFGKPKKVDKGKYYVIKFLEKQILQPSSYSHQTTLKLDVYLNQERTQPPEGGIGSMEFFYLSNMIMHHEVWDAGTALIL